MRDVPQQRWFCVAIFALIIGGGSVWVGAVAPSIDTRMARRDCGCGSIDARSIRYAPVQDADNRGAPTERRRIYHWERNLFAFVVSAFETAGMSTPRAIKLADSVIGLTNREAVTDPRVFARFAFRAIGFESEAADEAAEAAITRLTELHGEMRTVAALTTTPSQPRSSRTISMNNRAFFSWKSSLQGFLYAAFNEIGLEGQQATNAAIWARAHMDYLTEDSARSQDEPWRLLGPRRVLSEAFQTQGMSTFEADFLAEAVLVKLNVPGFIASRTSATELCPSYPVKMIWCENGDQHTEISYIRRNSWDSLMTACPVMSVCPTGQDWWWELTLADDDCPPEAPSGACVWIRVTGILQDIPCSDPHLSLDCFEETNNGIICSAIERVCADPISGPTGCPDCE